MRRVPADPPAQESLLESPPITLRNRRIQPSSDFRSGRSERPILSDPRLAQTGIRKLNLGERGSYPGRAPRRSEQGRLTLNRILHRRHLQSAPATRKATVVDPNKQVLVSSVNSRRCLKRQATVPGLT
jgi:hypothetical protein